MEKTESKNVEVCMDLFRFINESERSKQIILKTLNNILVTLSGEELKDYTARANNYVQRSGIKKQS
jgi:hypothetical protein